MISKQVVLSYLLALSRNENNTPEQQETIREITSFINECCIDLKTSLTDEELYGDYCHIMDMNKAVVTRYNELLECLPNSVELDILTEYWDLSEEHQPHVYVSDERKIKLKKLKSAVEMLEKQDFYKTPPEYEELNK